jgi:hypothetical protein
LYSWCSAPFPSFPFLITVSSVTPQLNQLNQVESEVESVNQCQATETRYFLLFPLITFSPTTKGDGSLYFSSSPLKRNKGTLMKIITLHPLIIVVEVFYATASKVRRPGILHHVMVLYCYLAKEHCGTIGIQLMKQLRLASGAIFYLISRGREIQKAKY